MPTIKQLNQRHPSYDCDKHETLAALYEGDDLFKSRLSDFLPQEEAESGARYALRKKKAHYRNYLGAVIDFFAALLFTSKPQPTASRSDDIVADTGDYYSDLAGDCDRGGTDIDEFFKARLIDAMVHRVSWWSLETPPFERAGTRAEFESSGMSDAWLRALDNSEVYDWENDMDGNLEWVIVHSKSARRSSIASGRDQIVETWEHYTSESVDTYSIEYDEKQKPADNVDVPLVAQRPHGFGTVPVLCMELPLALWAANRLKTPQVQHFRRINAQSWAFDKCCYPTLVLKLKDQNKMPSMGAGLGVVMGVEEEAEWISPPGTPFAEQAAEIKSQKDEIFRLAHQMALGVENNAAAVGRSAGSKAEDSKSTRVVMLAYSRQVKEALKRTYRLIGRLRDDGLEWSISGMNEFSSSDVDGLIAAVGELESGPGQVPSETFQAEVYKMIAENLLPDMSPETKATIGSEILRGVKVGNQLSDREPPDEDDDSEESQRGNGQTPPFQRNQMTQ